MYLLDTNVISALRRPELNPTIGIWMRSVLPKDAYLSAPTIAEIERGIVLKQRKEPHFAAVLEHWLNAIIAMFGDRILPVDTAVAQHWGRLSGLLGHVNQDQAIAATAIEHNLVVATRNIADFTRCGVSVFDPFSGTWHPPQ